MTMKKICAQVAAVFALTAMIGLNAPARASQLTWNWSWSDYSSNTGSGTFTTNALSSGSYLITGISGTWDGNTITGLLAPGSCCSYPPNDNLLLAGSPQLDDGGLGFVSNGIDINLYQYGGIYYYYTGDSSYGTFSAVLSSTSVSAPEPGSLALFGAALGLLALGALMRKLRKGAL